MDITDTAKEPSTITTSARSLSFVEALQRTQDVARELDVTLRRQLEQGQGRGGRFA